VEAHDAVWLPLPFLPAAIPPEALRRARGALRPGWWLLAGTFAGPADRLSELLVDLRTVRSGGHPWRAAELLGMAQQAGCVNGHELERTWPAPLRLFAAQRPASSGS
jgi:hypothetical protein